MRFIFVQMIAIGMMLLASALGLVTIIQISPQETRNVESQATVLKVPRNVLETHPYSPPTLAAAKEFWRAWRRTKEQAQELATAFRVPGGGATNFAAVANQMELLRRRLDEVRPLLMAYETLLGRPDFEIMVLAIDILEDDPPFLRRMSRDQSMYYQAPFFTPEISVAALVSAKLLGLKTILAAHEGRLDAARHGFELLKNAARHQNLDLPANRLLAWNVELIVVEIDEAVSGQCADPQRAALLAQDRSRTLSRFDLSPMDLPPSALFDLAGLREFHRRGIPLEIGEWTTRGVARAYCKAQAEFLKRKSAPASERDGDLQTMVDEEINAWRKAAGCDGVWDNPSETDAYQFHYPQPISSAELQQIQHLCEQKFAQYIDRNEDGKSNAPPARWAFDRGD